MAAQTPAGEFGELLRSSRLWQGMTQRELANASTISVRAIRDLESGAARHPRRQTVALLADALRLEPRDRAELARAARPAPSGERPARLATRIPAQLPRDIVDFVGRAEHTATLSGILGADLRGAAAMVAIVGMGGIGKTSVAVHVGHLVTAHFADGVLFVDLNGAGPHPLPVGDALTRLLRALDVREPDIPADLDERSALLRTITASRRMLFVLDNAHDATQVRPLLPGGRECAAVVTSRDGLAGLEGAHRVGLEPLGGRDAWTLLSHVIGAERLVAEPDATRDLIARCAGHPLALRIAASRLASRPSHTVRSLADRLAEPSAVLGELVAGDLAVRATFETSIASLHGGSPDEIAAAHAFDSLGLWPGDVLCLPAAAAMLDVPTVDAERALDRLVESHLVQTPYPSAYVLHDLVTTYAAERAQRGLTPAQRQAGLVRLLGWYLRAADQATTRFAPYARRLNMDDVTPPTAEPDFDGPSAALAWCDHERANLVAMVTTAADTGAHRQAWLLGTLLMPYFEQRMLWPEWIATHMCARESARRVGDVLGEGRALTGLAVAHRRSGDFRRSIDVAEQSLAVHRVLGDHVRALALMDTIGSARRELGDVDGAIAIFREILDDPNADTFRRATTLTHLGMIKESVGATDEAIVLLEHGLAIARAADLPHAEAAALQTLGAVRVRRGELDMAEAVLLECIERARTLDDRIHQAEALRHLARAVAAGGNRQRAAGHLAAAVDLMSALGHPDEAEARDELASLGASWPG